MRGAGAHQPRQRRAHRAAGAAACQRARARGRRRGATGGQRRTRGPAAGLQGPVGICGHTGLRGLSDGAGHGPALPTVAHGVIPPPAPGSGPAAPHCVPGSSRSRARSPTSTPGRPAPAPQ
ncbi:hypothetical protein G6F57_018661 [Rhizopus arrhizus]|nr:hypothetical protein G6F68_018992 [Rhizopus microsporus]KAG1256395.1 hypothetical protein G6F66_014821 [Rhizopus arrhizus]KAG1441609.1 hypothetical protein G6F57_018661 [Rhizopus arrhizus]